MSPPAPTVSVIILPHHDASSAISSLRRVLMQETDFEYEVVAAVRKDVDALRMQVDSLDADDRDRIRMSEIPPNSGPNQCLSTALASCEGSYVALVSSDVEWTSSDKLQKQLNHLEQHPSWSMSCHRVQLVDPANVKLPQEAPAVSKTVLTLTDLLQSDTIAKASAVVRRDALGSVPDWLQRLSVDAAWGWLLLHAAHGDVGCLSESLAIARVAPEDADDSAERVRRLKQQNLILRRLRTRLPDRYRRAVSRQLSENHGQLATEMDLQIRETAAWRHRRLCFLYGGWRCSLPVRTKISQFLHPFGVLHLIASRCFETGRSLRSSGRFAAFLLRTLIRQPSWLRRLGGATIKKGMTGLVHEWRILKYLFGSGAEEYRRWINQYDTLNDHDRTAIRQRIAAMNNRPRISVIVPVYNTPEVILRSTLDSVVGQLYDDWELCVADDASDSPHVRKVLTEYQQADSRIRCCFREERGNISAASNSALEMATAEFVTFLDHDDELAAHALYMVAEEIVRHPDVDLIYSDEDRIDGSGQRESPYFKTDWNPDLLLSQNMVCHLAVYRRDLLSRAGGLRIGLEGSQDHDLALRFSELTSVDRIRHIPAILYHWRRTPGSVSSDALSGVAAYERGVRAVQEHLDRRGVTATVSVQTDRGAPHYRVRYALPDPLPKVSVVILTKDRVELLRQCVEGLLHETDYPEMEIVIMDNNSRDSAALKYLEDLQRLSNVRVIRDTGEFNYSALNNQGVRAAAGEIVCLLNNDIEVIHADWLREMVSQAVQPGVGAVGARLLFPDDSVQHAGVMIGYGGGAGHIFSGLPRSTPVPLGRLEVTQTMSCVTAACMVLRKSVYEEFRGLDEDLFAVAYNDVDFCLRLSEAGRRIVWTPYATLYHHESASRGRRRNTSDQMRDQREGRALRQRWQERIAADPHLNPNISIEVPDYRPAFPPRVRRNWQQWQDAAVTDSGGSAT